MDTSIDWGHLPFGYYPTDYNVRCEFRDGKWGPIEVSQSDTINIHIAATSLHYGQEIFEGLKAFRGKDGKVRIFRLEENAKRMQESAKGLLMEPIPLELFKEMCLKAVKLNERFIPPYGSGASLYIRPLEIGLSPRIGVKEADEYLFIIMVTPVGPYFKGGFKNTNICIMRNFDRVAPQGTGRWKVGGNYAASMMPTHIAHEKGYSAVLFLDPKEKKISRRMWPGKLLRHQRRQIHHSQERLYPPLHHQHVADGNRSRDGHGSRAATDHRRRACRGF